jgi:hypothetical protein
MDHDAGALNMETDDMRSRSWGREQVSGSIRLNKDRGGNLCLQDVCGRRKKEKTSETTMDDNECQCHTLLISPYSSPERTTDSSK